MTDSDLIIKQVNYCTLYRKQYFCYNMNVLGVLGFRRLSIIIDEGYYFKNHKLFFAMLSVFVYSLKPLTRNETKGI